MAQISGAVSEKIFNLTSFRGLNESPDGDTKLRFGEASVCRNWRVTRDGNLKKRPGSAVTDGLCGGYASEASEDIRQEIALTGSAYMAMYPSAAAVHGSIVLSGDRVNVTAANAGSYTGYYMERAGAAWQLADCVNRDGVDTLRFYRVRAVPGEANPIAGLWSGYVNKHSVFLAACNGSLFRLADNESFETVVLGSVNTDRPVHMFGFDEKVYILNGTEYKVWDGTALVDVAGYIPLVSTAIGPDGTADAGGAVLEAVNRLCLSRRAWISPDGTNQTFSLPESGMASIDYVKELAIGTALTPGTDYTTDAAGGKVSFTAVPAQAVNAYEIGWTMPESVSLRAQVLGMRYSELYNGTQDTRVFLYGDGGNRLLYSGQDYSGQPRADYFPDLNDVSVGDANTPVTGAVRHHSRLIVYKGVSAYSVQYGSITLATGDVAAAFYSTPVNKLIGNEAPGQVALVLNNPRTLFGGEIYEWRSNTAYSGNLTADERQAKRISDRVYATIKTFRFPQCVCWDDNYRQEYYISYPAGKTVLVHNYAADAWYEYTGIQAAVFCSYGEELYYGTPDGFVMRFDENRKTDNGDEIPCVWESGSMSFGQDYIRKFSAMTWISIKPEASASVSVCVQTDRVSQTMERIVSSAMASLAHLNFADLSFKTNQRPFITRLKIKAKKFVYYKIIFQNGENTSATILGADIRVRFTSYAK